MTESFYDLYCLEVEKNKKLEKELIQVKAHNLSLRNRIKYLEDNQNDIIEKAVEKATHALKEEIIELKKQIDQLRSALNNDSANSGLPTTLTPLDKEKRIPNSREKRENWKVDRKDIKKVNCLLLMKMK